MGLETLKVIGYFLCGGIELSTLGSISGRAVYVGGSFHISITHFSIQKPLNLYSQQKSFGPLLHASVLEAGHTETETWDLHFREIDNK